MNPELQAKLTKVRLGNCPLFVTVANRPLVGVGSVHVAIAIKNSYLSAILQEILFSCWCLFTTLCIFWQQNGWMDDTGIDLVCLSIPPVESHMSIRCIS